jgi:hypothetical protein
MPTLNWHKREEAVRAATRAPYRLLEPVAELSYGDPDSENLLIQGDNLDALKDLLPYYAGRVRCIAIDPPYNTRSAFQHYDDNLEHSTWLSLMYPRLELLRDLLAEDGSIWVHIDDGEAEFRIEERADMYLIDVQGKRLVEKYLGSQATFGFEDVPTNVTDLALSRQLEKALRQQGIRPEVLLEFIRKTLGWLVNSRKLNVPTLLHVRFALEKALREKIEAYRQKAYNSGYQLRLFSASAAVEIGERSEETSRGQALFLWAVKKDEHGRDVHRQLQDKLATS